MPYRYDGDLMTPVGGIKRRSQEPGPAPDMPDGPDRRPADSGSKDTMVTT